MQKKLEAELISIAHRILKLKNKSELDQLYLETGKLYEKLAVLKFVETHFATAKPTIGHAEITDKLAVVFDGPQTEVQQNPENEVKLAEPENPEEEPIGQEEITEEEPVEEIPEVKEPQPEDEKDVVQRTGQIDSIEEETQAVDQEHEVQQTEGAEESVSEQHKEEYIKPAFELSFERKEDDDKKSPQQISFEDLLGGHDYSDAIFEKVDAKKAGGATEETPQSEAVGQAPVSEPIAPEPAQEETKEAPEPEAQQYQNATIDKSEYEKPIVAHQGKTITFALNDRIGFEKHLFGGSSEDMNRVVSQLNTFNTFQEAQDFIQDMVKPDYNDWQNKDDYAQRFMDIVEKKFS